MNKSQNITTAIGLVIMFAFIAVGVVYGHVDYDWEQDKCSSMKSSNYEFSHDVQLNADYAQHCYYYQHHPMAYMFNILMGIFLGMLFSIIPWAIILMLNTEIFDY